MRLITFLTIFSAFLFSACNQESSLPRAWEVTLSDEFSTTVNRKEVIARMQGDIEEVPATIKQMIHQRLELNQTNKSDMISLVSRPSEGVTYTIGPMWIEQRGKQLYLFELNNYDESGQAVGTSLAHGTADLEVFKDLLTSKLTERLKQTGILKAEHTSAQK